MGLAYVYILLLGIGIALVPYFIAARRGANKTFWFLMGLLFGPFAIPFVFFAKTDKSDNQRSCP